MKINWRAKTELLHRASIDPPIKREGMWNDGMDDGYIVDIGYVISTANRWRIVFYGTVCRGKHPVEDIVFDDLQSAKETMEKYGTALLVARYLSPA